MLFCPVCGNYLLTNKTPPGSLEDPTWILECRTCPYIHRITSRIERKVTNLPKKQVEDVLGGEAAWELADSTDIPCPRCSHPKAYYFQMQTRSADEPMTTFYRCANAECAHQWKEN
ncbi:DNA-directed RNA polymerase III subunit RPC10 [Gracilariopsis chorda]|uniref:DNA-directed RNA polymerase subunit n=1 Tax=Gracilariopsis chorda TaxID=448386 RepID=A0A2V3IZP7_9FLOR|nr:DNA-directed RNA polymerase III subunit RPC10 [Gracilariopsis chorda]|eukprot:PXF47523.1 DNA-directed RNA polymerase III subunit RPC10 [Gracilariopsis chorda]